MDLIATENQWRNIFKLSGIAALAAACFGVFDIIFGTITSSNLEQLPQTAIARFEEFQQSWALGLYHMDLLNVSISFLLLFVYFGIFALHRKCCPAYGSMAFMLSMIGTILFASSNSALAMFDAANKYLGATDEIQKMYYASVGETLLVRGEHGGYSVFPGFFLSTLSSLGMAYVMLKGNVFRKNSAYIGIVGHSLMLVYVVLVTFVPSLKTIAAVIAAPGGILALIWLLTVARQFLRFGSITPP